MCVPYFETEHLTTPRYMNGTSVLQMLSVMEILMSWTLFNALPI
jgi:hypothetical protein